MEKGIDSTNAEALQRKDSSSSVAGPASSVHSAVRLGGSLADALPPHESYEGYHRFDPAATWTPQEEKKVIRKCDIYLLSWLCLMVSLLNIRYRRENVHTNVIRSSLVSNLIVATCQMLLPTTC